MQIISNEASSPLQKSQEQLRQLGKEKQVKCFEVLLTWAKIRGYSGPVALQAATSSGEITAFAGLTPCDIVTQWGARQNLLLLLPLQAINSEEHKKLLQAACNYARQNYASSALGLLCFSREFESIRQLAPIHDFSPAWEYVLTVSFSIPEEAVWLLPFQERELQRHGGEIELPQELRMLWNCIEQF